MDNNVEGPPPRIAATTTDEQLTAELDQALAARRQRWSWAGLNGNGKHRQRATSQSSRSDDESIDSKENAVASIVEPVGLVATVPSDEPPPSQALFRFVHVYENQRGRTWLGFRFSSRALKSAFHFKDPATFTRVEANKEIDLPYTRLEEVQPPSTDWTWHGDEWLVDMAGDGMTSYDGFQYNTRFKARGWKATAPKHYFLSCVRRRRWLRLMVYLPAFVPAGPDGQYRSPSHIPASSEVSPAVSSPYLTKDDPALYDIWRGDDGDWTRCHAALKSLGRDGRKLELWRHWLGVGAGFKGKSRALVWTEDQGKSTLNGSSRIHDLVADPPLGFDTRQASKEHLVPLLQDHVKDIMNLFIFPDSRAQFVELLREAGIWGELHGTLDLLNSGDFWSRTSGLSQQDNS